MFIVCDKHIPLLAEAVRREWPEVDISPMEPEEIDAEAVRNADVLVVRTRTQVNEKLLKGTHIQLVCTATIGYDHIDTAYCDANNIQWMACPGCNAQAVCDYIEEAIEEVESQKSKVERKTIGIVGVGHVGTLVAQMAERRGMNVLLNDPPKKIGISLDEIARNCDVVSFHVPLDESTSHMCDKVFLSLCKQDTLIINAARGGVVDEKALLKSGLPFILDTWENEPHINLEAVRSARFASMHIAGYSLEGKRNATQMCLDAIARKFMLPPVVPVALPSCGDTASGWLQRVSDKLKAHPEDFETLRKAYKLR